MEIIHNKSFKGDKKYKYGDYQVKRTDDKERYYIKNTITGKIFWTYDKDERDRIAEELASKYEKQFEEINESDRIISKRKLLVFDYDSLIPYDTIVLHMDRITIEEYEKELKEKEKNKLKKKKIKDLDYSKSFYPAIIIISLIFLI